MKELSLNILDIAENSVKAKAKLIEITINEDEKTLTLIIKDDGCGMSQQTVRSVIDPFYTTRKTRSVGLGIPLLKLAAEQTGGSVDIVSVQNDGSGHPHGTTVTAIFFKNHLDFTPLGDVVSSITTLIQGHPDVDFRFVHTFGESSCSLDTREMRTILEGVPLNNYEVIKWIEGYLEEQYSIF